MTTRSSTLARAVRDRVGAGALVAPLICIDSLWVLPEREEGLTLVTCLRVLQRLVVLNLALLLPCHLVVKEEVCYNAFHLFGRDGTVPI